MSNMKPPIKNFKLDKYPNGDVTQWFDENSELYARFGLDGHNGIDIVAPHGTPMYAVEDGTVVNVKLTADGFGKHIQFVSDKEVDGASLVWVYGHCSAIHVKVGDKVKAGEHIADMGNTGFVVSGATPFWKINPYAGTHLHLGVREVTVGEGWSYDGSNIKMKVLNYDNGYKGSIDPYPLLANLTVDETEHRELQLTFVSLLNTLKKLLTK